MWWVEHGGRGCRLAGQVLIKQSIALLGWFTITIETMRKFGCINITIYCPPLLMVILKWPNSNILWVCSNIILEKPISVKHLTHGLLSVVERLYPSCRSP